MWVCVLANSRCHDEMPYIKWLESQQSIIASEAGMSEVRVCRFGPDKGFCPGLPRPPFHHLYGVRGWGDWALTASFSYKDTHPFVHWNLRWSIIACTNNLTTWDAEAAWPDVQSQPELHTEPSCWQTIVTLLIKGLSGLSISIATYSSVALLNDHLSLTESAFPGKAHRRQNPFFSASVKINYLLTVNLDTSLFIILYLLVHKSSILQGMVAKCL